MSFTYQHYASYKVRCHKAVTLCRSICLEPHLPFPNIRKKQLRLLNGIEKSWRIIQKNYYPEVTFQTLNRFANDKKYVPVDMKVCAALDLFADVSPYRQLPRWYNRTPESLAYFNGVRANIKKMFDEAKNEIKAAHR